LNKFIGKSIVKGLGIGEITKIKPLTLSISHEILSDRQVIDEIAKAKNIYKYSVENLKNEIVENKDLLNKETLAIINGHIILIEDEEITDRITEIIQLDKSDFVSACLKTQAEFIDIFEAIKDPYIKERIADVKDICHRFIKSYQNNDSQSLSGVVVAKEITPSDILNFEAHKVLGIISESNTANCHASILARALDIPFVTGIENIYNKTDDLDIALINADKDEVIINPSKSEYVSFKEDYTNYQNEKIELRKYIGKPATFKNDSTFTVGVNIGNLADVSIATEVKAESIGLFRSEYLYMDLTDFPTEDYLYNKYLEMTESIAGEITIRTLDVGGDKSIAYFNIPKEDNPYLGYRAIRYCLDYPEVLKTQFKAILRLSATKRVKIMIPMITKFDEVLEVKRVLSLSKEELKQRNIEFDDSIKLGIMIETPASVMISDSLANELDFFSIGTNDLLQYTMAADRNNQLVETNYNPYSKAFLNMIALTVRNASKKAIPVSVCGEIAANTKFLPLLIGLGVNKISVTPSALLKVKKALSETTYLECKNLLDEALKLDSEKQIEQKVLSGK
jgi:phosphotransferase system enzyme I (PtsI)